MLKGFEHSKSSSIHKTFWTYKEQRSAYRFFGNERVKEEHLIKSLGIACSKRCKGKRVLAYCDTSTINTNANKGRISNFDGLGIISRNQNNKPAIGFFIHPILVEDEQDGTLYGISALEIYNRSLERSTFDKTKRDVLRSIPIEEKESYKWVKPCIETRDKVLQQAEHITFVMDREGDIIEVFDRIPNEETDVVIRSMHNRKIITSEGKQVRLREELTNQSVSKKINLKIAKNGNKGRRRTITASVNHLSWASWVIARLAGWTEFYTKSRPPGNKTFKYGLEKFDAIMIGFELSG